jgi:hypothetical protein
MIAAIVVAQALAMTLLVPPYKHFVTLEMF